MDISRYETSDTFIIANPMMRSYTEEAEATLNSIYYQHLEANRDNIRAFNYEALLHAVSWVARRGASLDQRRIPKDHEYRRSPYGQPRERFAQRLSTEQSLHRYPSRRKLVMPAQHGFLQQSSKRPSRPEKERQPIAHLPHEPLMEKIKSSQVNLKSQQSKKPQYLPPLNNTLLNRRNKVEDEQEKKEPSKVARVGENVDVQLPLESSQKSSSLQDDYEFVEEPKEQNDDEEEQGEPSEHGKKLFPKSQPQEKKKKHSRKEMPPLDRLQEKKKSRKETPPLVRHQEKQKVAVVAKPSSKNIQIKFKKPKN